MGFLLVPDGSFLKFEEINPYFSGKMSQDEKNHHFSKNITIHMIVNIFSHLQEGFFLQSYALGWAAS